MRHNSKFNSITYYNSQNKTHFKEETILNKNNKKLDGRAVKTMIIIITIKNIKSYQLVLLKIIISIEFNH